MIATTETIQDNNAYWRLFSFQIVPRVFFYGRWVDFLTNDKRQNVYKKNCDHGNKKSKETRRTREQEECLWLRDDV